MILTLLTIGLITGVLTRLTGASGMSILISGLLLTGMGVRDIIGLTFAVTFVNAVAAIGPYVRNGHWDRRVTWAMGFPAFLAVLLGNGLGQSASSDLLTGIITVALFGAGIRFLKPRSTPVDDVPLPRRAPIAVLMIAGLLIGAIMGVLGGGGSIFISLLLIFGFRLPVRNALGSSIIIMGLAAIPGIVLNFNQGSLDPEYAVLLIIPRAISSFLASKLANRVPERVIERVLGVYLVVISLLLFYSRIVLQI